MNNTLFPAVYETRYWNEHNTTILLIIPRLSLFYEQLTNGNNLATHWTLPSVIRMWRRSRWRRKFQLRPENEREIDETFTLYATVLCETGPLAYMYMYNAQCTHCAWPNKNITRLNGTTLLISIKVPLYCTLYQLHNYTHIHTQWWIYLRSVIPNRYSSIQLL